MSDEVTLTLSQRVTVIGALVAALDGIQCELAEWTGPQSDPRSARDHMRQCWSRAKTTGIALEHMRWLELELPVVGRESYRRFIERCELELTRTS